VTGRATVAIVGGGFTGAAVAYHLAGQAGTFADIAVYEPRSLLGGGLAYDTGDPAHRINVPAEKMSLMPGDGGHFARWIAATDALSDDPGATGPDGQLYPRRSVFGRYVDAHVRPFVARGRIAHIKEAVTGVARDGGRWIVATASGRRDAADIVVLATTHPAPEPPAILTAALAGDPRFIADANAPGALSAIASAARVLIVGTGLTMADVVASLDARGHAGAITATSRRGLRSRGHPARAVEPFGDFLDPPATTALGLLRRVRAAIRAAAAQGVTWHPVIDAVRAQASKFWQALPVGERQRIVRHLRPYWDAHRFRIAPQPEAVIDRRLGDGSLEIFAGSLEQAKASGAGIQIAIRRRRSKVIEHRAVDAVIVTTGPAHDRALSNEPHLAALARAGWIRPDALGLGVACGLDARALDRHGAPVPTLFVAGPLARAAFGELMGLPQVSDFALFVAGEAGQELRAIRHRQAEPPVLAAPGPCLR